MEQQPAPTSQALQPGTTDAASQLDSSGTEAHPGFAGRGRMRRRARFLRKARELAYRDLGGLVFSLHRFGQRNDALVLAKLGTLSQIDTELRALEGALQESQPITVLREAGITACPRCAAIHGSEDRFCPNCGLPMSRHVDLPIAGPATLPAPASPPPPPTPPAPPAPVRAGDGLRGASAAPTPPPPPAP
ncbi:MAG TPA: zinc ribbon domain-containing protein, partial [Solirubrobacteraceae bacterium]|nr:zinc ribbon domain-containing protein [Solirubrobacteraceae bacterium]